MPQRAVNLFVITMSGSPGVRDGPAVPSSAAGSGSAAKRDQSGEVVLQHVTSVGLSPADVALSALYGIRTNSAWPAPTIMTPTNVSAVFSSVSGRANAGELFLEYLAVCLRHLERLAPADSFCTAPKLSWRDVGLLKYALGILRKETAGVPAVPRDIYSPHVCGRYATLLINKFKPLVRRSDAVYEALGALVHIRIRVREASFEEWMQSSQVSMDPQLVVMLRNHERPILAFLRGIVESSHYKVASRGLQSALKYEEFYLKPFSPDRRESVLQLYTRIAGHLACRSESMCRVALGKNGTWMEMFQYFFEHLHSHTIVPSTPAMLNLGTTNCYTASCYLLNPQTSTVKSSLSAITGNVSTILSHNGGIGLCMQDLNDAQANQISTIPVLKALDSLVAAHNKNSRRPTGVCVYIEPWHSDIRALLRTRGVLAGEEAQRCDNIFSAMWMPDLFFKRLIRYLDGDKDVVWTLFDGETGGDLSRLHGDAFEKRYESLEKQGLGERVPIQDIAYAIVRSAAIAGSPFIMFKDAVNRHYIYDTQGSAISCSNLCTEIVHPADQSMSGVCNLGSVNLAQCVLDGAFSFALLRSAVRACVLMVNIMIDTTSMPTVRCRRGQNRLRSMGIGMQGLHTACLMLGLDMVSEDFRRLNRLIAEVMLLSAMQTSNALCIHGAPTFRDFPKSMYSKGVFHWERFPDARPAFPGEWELLRRSIKRYGLRNSQFVALMPTVTSSQVSDVSESFAPMFTNMFSKVTKDGEMLRPNILLMRELRRVFGTPLPHAILDALDKNQWSVVKALPCLSPDSPLARFKTAFDYSQEDLIDLCADRAPYVDHSQSMTLYVTERADGTLPASVITRLLVHAYKRGLKTGMYYCKVRKATNSGVFGGDDSLVCSACVL
ncbi:ribonucleotide reductase subunit 1 [Leporid alphaherpesvirus 4]|uniref:Ribonucleoside-diphosphate reductase n=2 Tax=Leporid alphaherpesvirus 4 TaxID=481315 RepID=J9QVD4_9ALPH|nr:ribonucleotide reductase subunit 1 [Leporid alphaherpesvirus 4]AFR32480.1 ribonucleotide reductase subunit 1 [Leporid alphaherpesvirus 4]